ncbi:hypothetical protein ES703_23821 [subsurface metagenome]
MRRTMTGRPSMASKIPSKSFLWKGRIASSAALYSLTAGLPSASFMRPVSSAFSASSSGLRSSPFSRSLILLRIGAAVSDWRIILTMFSLRLISSPSWSKNMCSVLQRPMPSAPNRRALAASSGLSAFVLTPSLRTSSAQSSACWSSFSSSMFGIIVSITPAYTSPVAPSMDIQSPSLNFLPFTVNELSWELILISSAPATHGFPQPLATTAAWEVPPPCWVRNALETIIALTSWGVVSGLTMITLSPAFPLSSALSALKMAMPEAAPGEAFNPTVSRSPLASAAFLDAGSNWGWRSWSMLSGVILMRAVSLSMSPSLTMSTAVLMAALAVLLPVRVWRM